ncbi:unnamed protein product, partial [Discosporangium mesarthrocarpum]
RRVPPPRELLKRVDSAIDELDNLRDAKNGKVLLHPGVMDAMGELHKHTQGGCVSDPEEVALHIAMGKTEVGLTSFRCARCTNSTE